MLLLRNTNGGCMALFTSFKLASDRLGEGTEEERLVCHTLHGTNAQNIIRTLHSLHKQLSACENGADTAALTVQSDYR
jgi:hypothetical protein